MTKLYLVPKQITHTQLEKIFGEKLDYVQHHNYKDQLVVLKESADEQQHSIMELIYNS